MPKQPDMEKADKIFQKINKHLVPKHKGKILAIETDSGEYYIGNDISEAYEKATRQHPEKLFAFKRIGFGYVYFAGGM